MHKRDLMDLAIFGGPPAFKNKRHVGYPNIGNRERLLQRINELLDSRKFTNRGPFVRELESKISNYLGVKHCIAMTNGTIALEIAIRALELSGEVLIPSMTFVATAHALQWQQITPVFVDVDPNTYTIDPYRIKTMITPKTTGIIGVHLWGRPCNIDKLSQIAYQNNLKLMFDAAHAFGCSYKGNLIGCFGDVEVLSFHATKFFNTFEGGAVLTNNDDLAEKIRLMQNFGFSGRDSVVYIGTNGKMSEISAIMGLTGFESLNSFIERNYFNYKLYQEELSQLPGIKIFSYDETQKNNYQYIVLQIDEELTKLERDLIIQILEAENVLARRYFYPGCHQMEPYRSYFPHVGLLLPETERLVRQVLTLPTGAGVAPKDIKKIATIIKFLIQNGNELKDKIKNQILEKIPA
jgi:dTDP-4-amino-4,6-dideoxygalactose transaminase